MTEFKTVPFSENFLAYIHHYAMGYQFGTYKILQHDSGLWYVEDKFGGRLNADGLFISQPPVHYDRGAWILDTAHSFRDCYELLRQHVEPTVLKLPSAS